MQMAGERARLGGDSFFQVSIPDDHIDGVIENREFGLVEPLREVFLRYCHPNRVGKPLAEGTGGHLDSGCPAVLRMPGSAAPPLPEVLDVLKRKIVPREMEEGILEHAPVTGGEDKPVAVHPGRIRWVMLQVLGPENICSRRHSHRHPGMTGFCFLHRIHCEAANRVDRELIKFRHAGMPHQAHL